jgi:hypothetical protein
MAIVVTEAQFKYPCEVCAAHNRMKWNGMLHREPTEQQGDKPDRETGVRRTRNASGNIAWMILSPLQRLGASS